MKMRKAKTGFRKKPSEPSPSSQETFFVGALRFWASAFQKPRVLRAKRRAHFTSHRRVAAASEFVGLLTALPATAAAKRNANNAPERKLSHLQVLDSHPNAAREDTAVHNAVADAVDIRSHIAERHKAAQGTAVQQQHSRQDALEKEGPERAEVEEGHRRGEAHPRRRSDLWD